MDRCDEVFQRVYETMFEQTDDPLPDVVPVTRELRCQMLQQHFRHSSQRLMQRCGVDRSDADLQRIGSCFQQLRRMECAILFRCAWQIRRKAPEALATMAAEDERCGNAANYAYDTMIGLFSTCVFRPPFLDSHEEGEVLYNEIYSARGSFTRRMRLPDGDRGLTELLDLGYDLLRLYAKKAFDYGARLA